MKKTIAVIFGGRSTEYSVSLQSACSVLKESCRRICIISQAESEESE